jgi:hypothetical protein
MCCPAGVRDSYVPAEFLLTCQLAELRNPPYRTQAVQATIVYSDAGRIVTSVFKAPQPLEKSRNDVTIGYRTDYTAHMKLPSCPE